MLLLAVAVAHAACPATPSTLEAELESAQVSFYAMDGSGFRAFTDDAFVSAECLSAPVLPPLAARLHRVRGLREFFEGREDAARLAFAAALATDPGYDFPDALLPPGHPVRQLYDRARGTVSNATALAPPQVGHIEIDGVRATLRPTDRPTLALHVDPAGAVSRSAYLWPGDPLFPYAVAGGTTEVQGRTLTQPVARVRRGPNVPLAIASGVSVVAAGVCWGVAKGTHDEFYDGGTSPEELEELRSQTNTLFLASVGIGVLAVGTGVGAVVAGTW